MADTFREFMIANQVTESEARTMLELCEGNYSAAWELFSLYPRELCTALLDNFPFALNVLSSDVCDMISKDFSQFFPCDLVGECLLKCASQDRHFMTIVTLRAFANQGQGVIQREQFAQALQLGMTALLPLFREWARELNSLVHARKDSLEWDTARARLMTLLNHTLPSVVETNAAFHGIVQDVANLRAYNSYGTAQTALHVAASLGDIEFANNLLERNVRLDTKDGFGGTALHVGIDHPKIVRALLRAAEGTQQLEQFFQQTNSKRQTPLHLCTSAESARLLVRVSPPSLVFAQDQKGNTALHANVNHPGIVEILLSSIHDVKQRKLFVRRVDCDKRTALHVCNNVESARLILRVFPRLARTKDQDRITPLHWNVGNPEMVQVLLAAIEDSEQRVKFVQQASLLGQTPLSLCTSAESMRLMLHYSPSSLFFKDLGNTNALFWHAKFPAIIQICLDAAREAGQLVQFVEQVDDVGQTALHFCDNLESARLMLAALPSLASVKCAAGNIPLHIHATRGSADICRLELEEYHVDVNATNMYGQTALHLACLSHAEDVVALLLKHSPNLLATDNFRRTALHCALMEEWKDYASEERYLSKRIRPSDRSQTPTCVAFLLALAEANISAAELVAARDMFGETALHYLAKLPEVDAFSADVLMLAGAAGNAQDDQGHTAMHFAVCGEDTNLALHLIKHWGLSVQVEYIEGVTALDIVDDMQAKAELQRASILASAVTLRFAARPKPVPSPWKRLPRELFRELCSFLV